MYQYLKQLVQVNNGAFTAWLNESQKGGLPGLILHKELDDTMEDEIDFFMQIDKSSKNLDEICARVKAVTYINPADIVEEKIICGDRGDNIKSVIRVEKNNRTYRVSETDWNKVKTKLDIDTLDGFFINKDLICEELSKLSKYSKYAMKHIFSLKYLDIQKKDCLTFLSDNPLLLLLFCSLVIVLY